MSTGTANLALLTLGGTIAMTGEQGGGVAPALDAGDLGRLLAPDQRDLVCVRTVAAEPGPNLTLGHVFDVAALIQELFATGTDGFVVTQGTDTIEEVAFALELLLGPVGPVVVTGAMRPADAPSADGPRNLRSAISVAQATTRRDTGVLVVLDDTVHAARFVTKRHRHGVAAFASGPPGPLGHVVEDEVRLFWLPPPLELGLSPQLSGEPRVTVVPIGLGSGPDVISAARDADGIVVAGVGAGHVPEIAAGAVRSLARDKPVVLASRVPDGEVLERTYGYPGSERDLLRHGLVSARWLEAWKARILLQLLLACGLDARDAVEAFATIRDRVYAIPAGPRR